MDMKQIRLARSIHSTGYLASTDKGILLYWDRLLPSALTVAISLAAMLLLLCAVRTMARYETSLPNKTQIIMFETTATSATGTKINVALTPYRFAEEIQKSTPKVELVTQIFGTKGFVEKAGRYESEKISLVDRNFFQVFHLPILTGQLQSFAEAKNGAVITSAIARKHGLSVGDTMSIRFFSHAETFRISAIVEDYPQPTQFTDKIFVAFDQARAGLSDQNLTQWNQTIFKTYGKQKATLIPRPFVHNIKNEDTNELEFQLKIKAIPVSKLFFQSEAPESEFSGITDGRRDMFNAFLIVTSAIFALAVLAYVNVTTAQIAARAPEVSLRRLYGCSRRSIISGFYIETAVVVGLGGLLALILAAAALPFFAALLGMQLQAGWLEGTGILAQAALLAGLMTLASGAYTALKLANIPVSIAVRNLPYEPHKRQNHLAQAIVAVQFVTGMGALTMAIVCATQLRFAEKYDMGFDTQHSMIIANADTQQFLENQQTMLERLARVPLVTGAGLANYSGATDDPSFMRLARNASDDAISAQWIAANGDYFQSLGIPVLAGDFGNYAEWSAESRALVINRKLGATLGFKNPADAIGKSVSIMKKAGPQISRIVAVVENVRLDSLRNPVEPQFYINRPDMFSYLFVGIKPDRLEQAKIWLNDIWSEVMPGAPLEMRSYQSQIETARHADVRFTGLLNGLSLVLCLTSLMAFWGLSMDMVIRRKIEYMLHHLYGAGLGRIVRYLTHSLMPWAMSGVYAGFLVALYLAHRWVAGFDVKAPSPVGGYLIAMAVLAGLMILAIIIHGRRLLKSDMSEVLKYE